MISITLHNLVYIFPLILFNTNHLFISSAIVGIGISTERLKTPFTRHRCNEIYCVNDNSLSHFVASCWVCFVEVKREYESFESFSSLSLCLQPLLKPPKWFYMSWRKWTLKYIKDEKVIKMLFHIQLIAFDSFTFVLWRGKCTNVFHFEWWKMLSRIPVNMLRLKITLNKSFPVWTEFVTLRNMVILLGNLYVLFSLCFVSKQMTLLFVLMQKRTKLHKNIQMDILKFQFQKPFNALTFRKLNVS